MPRGLRITRIGDLNRGVYNSIAMIYKENGVEIPLTGSTVTLTAKSTLYDTSPTDSTAVFKITGIISEDEPWRILFPITATQSYLDPKKTYYADIVVVDEDNVPLRKAILTFNVNAAPNNSESSNTATDGAVGSTVTVDSGTNVVTVNVATGERGAQGLPGTDGRDGIDGEGVRVYDSVADFPSVGASSIVFIDKSTGESYTWEDGAYVPIPSAAPTGGYVDSFDFGTLTPTQAQITQQVATEVWAAGTLDSSNADATQWTFTETASGTVHSVMDIFNGTRIRNLFHDDGTGVSDGTGTDIWEVAVSATTTPPVFSWAHIGQEARAAQIIIDGQPYSGQITLIPY